MHLRDHFTFRRLLEAAVLVLFVLLVWNNYTLRRNVVAAAKTGQQRGFGPRDVVGAIPTVGMDGRKSLLDLRSRRAIVAVVDPRCESCVALVESLRGATDVRVLSLAPMKETQTMAASAGLTGVTHLVQASVPVAVGSRLQIYPQLFVVDRGKVVRTCATVAECR